MAHQFMPKIFRDPHKNPPAPLLHTGCTVPEVSQAMKFGQLIECNMTNISLEKSYTKCGRN